MLNDKGMTLVEVVVSMIILSIIMLGVTTGYLASLKQDLATADYQAISDDLKVQLDNLDLTDASPNTTVTVTFNDGAQIVDIEAVRTELTSAEEPTISFVRYVAK